MSGANNFWNNKKLLTLLITFSISRLFSVTFVSSEFRHCAVCYRASLDPNKFIQVLQPSYPASRVHFCSWFLQSVAKHEIGMQFMLFSDEAWFHLQRYLNRQNNGYWSSQNPHLTHEVLLYQVKVGVVWCGVNPKRSGGPIFLMKQCLGAEGQHIQHHLWPVTTSFRSLPVNMHTDSSAKLIYALQQMVHLSPWSTGPLAGQQRKELPCM
jgi:hypothetical protein